MHNLCVSPHQGGLGEQVLASPETLRIMCQRHYANISSTSIFDNFANTFAWKILKETINVFMQMDESTYSMKLQAAVLQRIDLLGLGLAHIFLLWVNSFCGFMFVL